jgi:inhibitor of KinA
MPPFPRVLAAGDAALTIEFGITINPAIHDRVLAFAHAVDTLSVDGLIETVPTYRSATVYFDPCKINTDQLAERLKALVQVLPPSSTHSPRLVEIPVLYGGACGPDLPDVADFARLTAEEAAALHASVEYRVYMLGFSPGFPYMGRVPDPLAMPRLATPRAKVPAGSVGIAGSQTGIYPLETPGGWRVVGRTPLRLYDLGRTPPFLLEPGDCVRFVAIDRQEFDRLAAETG